MQVQDRCISLAEIYCRGGGVFKNVRKLRNWKEWDPRDGSKSKREAKKTKGMFRKKISRWQLFYRPAWGVSSVTVKTDRG